MQDDDHQELAQLLGASIRAARRKQGMTLTQLAKKTGLSQPFLSRAETGNVMPSVINLHRIGQALGTTAHDLLACGSRPMAKVIRSTDAKKYELAVGGVLRFCVEGSTLMHCNEVTAEPHSAAEAATTHAGEEFVYVIDGRIRMLIDSDEFLLEKGDTVYYVAASRHQWFNDADEPARFLFIGSPPSF